MSVVAQIRVPDPEPFVETADGAEAVGAGYTFTAPAVATEPLVMQASDGTAFLWTPTELCYGDSAGLLDYIAGSAPAELTVRGRSVHYPRTFPSSEEVHVALPEGRKYWLNLHEPPRQPAPYLSGDVWFGVSGMVGGIPLPPGRHETMESMGFSFPRPVAVDLMGQQVEGWYEVVNTDEGQQLFICVPAEWLLDPDRVYPVKVDPTVGTTTRDLGTANPNQRKIGEFRNSTILAHFNTDSGAEFYQSADGIQFSEVLGARIATADSFGGSGSLHIVDDIIFFVCRVGGYVSLYRGTPHFTSDRILDSIAWSTPLQLGGAFYPDLVVHRDDTPGGYVVHVVWSRQSSSQHYADYQRVKIAPDGGMSTDGAAFTLGGNYGANIAVFPAIAVDNSKRLYVTWSASMGGLGKGQRFRMALPQSGSWVWQSDEPVYEAERAQDPGYPLVDSVGRVYYAFRLVNAVSWLLFRRNTSGAWENISPVPPQSEKQPLIFLSPDDKLYVFYLNQGGVRYRVFDGGTWGQEQVVDVTTTAGYPSAGRMAPSTGVMLLMYLTGDASPYTVNAHRMVLNQPPYAALITSPAACAAETGADIAITHQDPDGGEMGAWTLRRRYGTTTEWWNANTKVWQAGETYNAGSGYSVMIPAADNAGQWQTGVIYQLSASTRDNSGETGPYTDPAVVLNVGATPSVTITGPTGTVNSGEAVVTWACDVVTSAYQVRVRQGETIVSDTEKRTGTNVRAFAVSGLKNGLTYTPEVTVWDSTAGGGIPSAASTGVSFVVDYTDPNPARDLVALGDAVLAAVKLRWARDYVAPATFSRASVAYLPDGAEVAPGQPRYDTEGIWAEEGTVNLAKDGGFDSATAIGAAGSPWTVLGMLGSGDSVSKDSNVRMGSVGSSAKVVCASGNTLGVQQIVTGWTAGASNTISADIYVAERTSGVVQIDVVAQDSGGASVLDSPGKSITAPNGGFVRYVETVTLPADTATVTIRVFANTSPNCTFYVDNVQLEPKAYATTPVVFADDSTQATRAVEKLTHPGSVVSAAAGTVEVDAVVHEAAASIVTPQLWRSSTTADRIVVYLNAGKPTCAGPGASIAAADVITAGKHRFGWRWEGLTLSFWIDGARVGTALMSKPPIIDENVGVGCHPSDPNDQRWDQLLGPLRVSNVARSDVEMANTAPLTRDENTTALFTWANTLEGGTQPSIFSGQYGVERSEDGQTWKRIAVVDNPAEGDVTYDDHAVGSGRVYDYRVVAYGSNGTETAGEAVQAAIIINGGIWLHDPRDPANTAHYFNYHEVPSNHQPEIPSGVFQFAGRKNAVVQMDASQMSQTLRYRLFLPKETGDYDAFWSLFNRRTTLCLRNHWGEKFYCAVTRMPTDRDKSGRWVDVEFQVVDFTEEV